MNLGQARHYHEQQDPHRHPTRLADIILGGQDGLVNVLGLVLGVAGASSEGRLVLVAGLAGAIAESVSMAAVAYTSRAAEQKIYESERQREHRHIVAVPELERDELRELYRARGFDGELLERIVERLTADPEVWVAVMMAEEHRLRPVPHADALRSAAVVGVASLVGSLIPLVPFLFLGALAGALASAALATVTLFATGAWQARITVGNPLRGGVQLAVVGLTAALLGFGVGRLLRISPS